MFVIYAGRREVIEALFIFFFFGHLLAIDSLSSGGEHMLPTSSWRMRISIGGVMHDVLLW